MTAVLEEESIVLVLDEALPVCNRADAEAVASLVQRCCGTSFLICDRHLRRARARVESGVALKCKTCGTHVTGRSFDAVYRVVEL